MNLEFGLLVGAILIYLSILISKTGFKFGIPTLLLFLLAVRWTADIPESESSSLPIPQARRDA